MLFVVHFRALDPRCDQIRTDLATLKKILTTTFVKNGAQNWGNLGGILKMKSNYTLWLLFRQLLENLGFFLFPHLVALNLESSRELCLKF